MDLAALVTQGGGWAVGLAVCWLVGTGKLRLAREVVVLEEQLEKQTLSFEAQTAKLEAAATRETESLRASLEAAETRVADIGARFDRYLESKATEAGGTR